ncbi:YibE/F family protein [Candidatus Peregrinibacteria bacterium]|nr:YibE/F family protein [Candidatus Peregrinibacteria bacterium]
MNNKNLSKVFPPFLLLLVVVALLFFSPFSKNDASDFPPSDADASFKAEVIKIVEQKGAGQILEVKLEDEKTGGDEGKILTIENDESMAAIARKFVPGDKVLLAMIKDIEGTENFYIVDYVRQSALIWLFVIFLAIVILVAKWQGLGSIVGLFISFVVIFKMILPLMMSGFDPIWAALLGALLIIPSTFYFSHGVSRKTTIACLSTILTLAFTALLAKIFANFGYLTGLASEEVSYLQLETVSNLDFKGLVVAGIIIGILGVLDDITISQASIVQQLKSVKNKIGFGELYGRALKVGKDHIASIVNTLILVYTGASLPLLLLFLDFGQSFSSVVNLEFVAQEVISTLVASIGLILAVPITTFFAALFLGKNNVKGESYICKH